MTHSGERESAIDEVIAKHRINELMKMYCRGMDRADHKLLESVFHPDATVITGAVDGSASVFCRDICRYLTTNLDSCYHSVNDGWIKLMGSRASGEFYVLAAMTAGGTLTIGGGRYADEFELHDGSWRITSHTFISDWLVSYSEPGSFSRDELPASLPRGLFGPQDKIYELWSKHRS